MRSAGRMDNGQRVAAAIVGIFIFGILTDILVDESGGMELKLTHMLAVVGNNPDVPLRFREPLAPEFCKRDPSRDAATQPDRDAHAVYEWQPLRHSIEDELDISCRRLKESAQSIGELGTQVEERTAWALGLGLELAERDREVVRLQREAEELRLAYCRLAEAAQEINRMFGERTAWALQLQQEVEHRTAQVVGLQQQVEESNRELERRTAWALGLDEELADGIQRLEERTQWALRLDQELQQRTADALRFGEELARLGWAHAIDRRFHNVLQAAWNMVRWGRDKINRVLPDRRGPI
jgi:hypothetical protein